MKKMFPMIVAATLAGCGSGITGEYGGKDCVYEKLSFKSDGAVYVTVMGMEMPAQYKVDGDRVSVMADGKGLVFTKKGDTLEAGMAGKCRKL